VIRRFLATPHVELSQVAPENMRTNPRRGIKALSPGVTQCDPSVFGNTVCRVVTGPRQKTCAQIHDEGSKLKQASDLWRKGIHEDFITTSFFAGQEVVQKYNLNKVARKYSVIKLYFQNYITRHRNLFLPA
jgi:hypothetical protein